MAYDLPRAHLAHRVPRRLRVCVPSRKGDRGYFDEAVDKLRGEPSIRSVRASARTGSIVIEHGGQAPEVARLAREARVFDLPEAAVAGLLRDCAREMLASGLWLGARAPTTSAVPDARRR